jgi:hypothetical protein
MKFDSVASMTLVTKKVAAMGLNYENAKYELNTVGANCFEGCGAIQVPLRLPDGKTHVLKALIVEGSLGQVDVLPIPYDVAQVLGVPKEKFAARNGGAIDIMVGQDNSHLFPQALGATKMTGYNLQLFRAVLGKGLMYAGSTGPGWSGAMRKTVAHGSLLSFGMLLLTGLCVLTPASGFVAFDCMNASNVVEASSLLAPEECHLTGGEHKVERIVQAEVVQIKRERTVSVFRCQVLETLVSKYCGYSSAAGVTRYLRFREPLLVEANSCRRALVENGNITIMNRSFQARIGTTTSHSFFVADGLDDGHHCQTGSVSVGSQVLEYQATQAILEITLWEDFGKVNDVHGTIKLPGGVQAKVTNQAVSDSLVGTIVRKHKTTTCPGGLTQLLLLSVNVNSILYAVGEIFKTLSVLNIRFRAGAASP